MTGVWSNAGMISKIGRYEIQAQIGAGGFGNVYGALDTAVGRRVAIKFLSATADPEMLKRFRSEMGTAGRLLHRNIVTVYDIGEHDGAPYIVFEFLDGRTLQQLILDQSPVRMLDRARILLEVAEGLTYAHAHGVVHRDIKPANAMVLRDGSVKLMDFGIARVAGTGDARLTRGAYMIGTLLYMAPEQFTGGDADALTDIFAFGVTAYEFVSGKHPFEARDEASVMYRIMTQEAEPIEKLAPDCPVELAAVINRAMAKERALRYQNADELVVDLSAVVADLARHHAAELVEQSEASLKAGADQTAEEKLREALQLDPMNEQALPLRKELQRKLRQKVVQERVGQLLAEARSEAEQNPAEALALLESALRLEPTNEEIAKLRQRVESRKSELQSLKPAAAGTPLTAPDRIGMRPPPGPPAPPPAPAGGQPWQWFILILAGAAGIVALTVLLPATVYNASPALRWVVCGVLALVALIAAVRSRRTRPLQKQASTIPSLGQTMLQPAPRLDQLRAAVPGMPQAQAASPDATKLFLRSDLAPERLTNISLFVGNSADPTIIGTTIAVTCFPFRIGRTNADFSLPGDAGVSQQHAAIEFKDGGFFIRDLGSANGTYVGGKRLRADQVDPLPFGTTIQLSNSTTLVFHSREMQLLPDLTGVTIAERFTLEKMLHSSHKSVTYVAADRNLSCRVALKILSPQLSQFAGYNEQFRNEALTAAALRHPNICRVLDFGQAVIPIPGRTARSNYLCTEFMKGGSVAGALERAGGVAPAEARRCIRQIADALDYAHSCGVVHAGLKPTAIVFDEHGTAYLTDFAIASRRGNEIRWSVSGAPAFMAPEQWEGNEATNLSDQYSLAVLAYLLLTGSRPYEAQENPEMRRRNFASGPVLAHEESARNGRALPPAVSAVLQQALATRPSQRYGSTTEFATALDGAFVEPNAGAKAPPRVFISYHREASAGWANLFADKLVEKHGVLAFVDVQSMDGAESFPVRIQREIESCDFFVCFLAEPTLGSTWVRREIEIAHSSGRTMVPVFQESFRRPVSDETGSASLRALLDYQGVYLFDRLNIHIDHSIADVARIVRPVRPTRT